MQESPTSWKLSPGDRIQRTVLHAEYGGRAQGGIGPSKLTPNVLVFSDPASGEKHGYFDGWQPDGCFHYTGEGQFGDQRMVSGNASILNHDAEGRAVRLFYGARGTVTYVDEFELADPRPFYETDAPESEAAGRDRKIRKVIVFRLRPKTIPPGQPTSRLAEAISGRPVEHVPIEARWTEKAFVNPSGQSHEAERREAKLVEDFADYLRSRLQHSVSRTKVVPNGEYKPIFTDVFDETIKLVVEAKGVATREAVRMGIGQLADYIRFLPGSRRAMLFPGRPRTDLEELAKSQGISLIWPDGSTYASNDPSVNLQAAG